MPKKKIVILGGGYGGIAATKKLYSHFKRKRDVEITLIDKNPYHTLMTELHEVAGSRVEPDAVQVSFKKIFGGTGVKLKCDDIVDIDFENRVLKSEQEQYSYDYLVIGAGGEPEFFDLPGVQENAFTLWSFDEALRLRHQVEDRFREAARQVDPEKRKKMLTFVIAGAGFTGIELAGEILERRDSLCRRYHLKKCEVRVLIVEALDTILPILPPKMQDKAEAYLKKKGAEIMTEAPVVGAEEGLVKLGPNKEIATDTFIWTCGIQGSEFTARIPLTKGQYAKGQCSYASSEGIHGMAGCHLEDDERYIVGERGRILVDEEMKSVDHDNVYLVGDILWYLENEKVLPQIVETALQTGDVAAENIIADIEAKPKKKFKSNYHGFMISLGGKYAVAHVAGVSLTGIFAMAMKHLINMHYLFGLAGVNAVWGYLQHEFFTIKENRSILGNHLSAKIPNYWAVPLRLFLGGKWLFEGIKHILEGWLNPGDGGLTEVWTGAIKLPGVAFEDAASAATGADAGSAATGAAAEGAAEGAAEYGEPLMEALGIYTWFAENVLSASPLLAFLLQSAVVLGQVAIGLALIGGLLTFPAALVSIGFSIMFIFSGWGNPELLWYIMVSIVMLGGAGRGFGLDHWVMPWLKHQWNSTKLAQKTHLYDDEPVIKK